ncbi:TPA: Dot/Icm T4SS effector Ceg9 [Legionella anisa]
MYNNLLFFSNVTSMRFNKFDQNRYQSLWEHNRRDIKHTFIGTIASKSEFVGVLFQPVTASFSMLAGATLAQLLLPYSLCILFMGDSEFALATLINYLEITILAIAMPIIALLSTIARGVATVKCLLEDKYTLEDMVEDENMEPYKIYLLATEHSFDTFNENNEVSKVTYHKLQYKMMHNGMIYTGTFTLSDLHREPNCFDGKSSSLTLYKYDILHLIKGVHKLEEMEEYHVRSSYGYS